VRKKATTISVDEDGKLILNTNEVGHVIVKAGHLPRLMKRLVDPNAYGISF
jgi:hypothetical protein